MMPTGFTLRSQTSKLTTLKSRTLQAEAITLHVPKSRLALPTLNLKAVSLEAQKILGSPVASSPNLDQAISPVSV